MGWVTSVLVDTGDPDWRHDLFAYLATRGFASTEGFLAHHDRPPDSNPEHLVDEVYGSVVDLAAELGIRLLDIAAGGGRL